MHKLIDCDRMTNLCHTEEFDISQRGTALLNQIRTLALQDCHLSSKIDFSTVHVTPIKLSEDIRSMNVHQRKNVVHFTGIMISKLRWNKRRNTVFILPVLYHWNSHYCIQIICAQKKSFTFFGQLRRFFNFISVLTSKTRTNYFENVKQNFIEIH